MAGKDQQATIKKITQELLAQLGLSIDFSLEEQDSQFYLNFRSDNPGLLIGYHGQTLSALQLILALMVYRQLGEWAKIVVDVGDYRQRRQESLERLAVSVAQKVKITGQTQALTPMNPNERRIVHLALANDPEIETASEGEGKERRIIIRLRQTTGQQDVSSAG